MNSLLLWKSSCPVKSNSGERGHVCWWGGVIGSTLQSDDLNIVECTTVIPFSSEWSEFRQVYSSVHFIITASHDQFTCFTTETECIITKLNGSQFRQIYPSFSLQAIHSQILHENSNRMQHDQKEVISNWACLFIISFFQNHSSIPVKRYRNCNCLHSVLPFQSPPKKAHSQSHTRNNQRRNEDPYSILSLSHNPSNRNGDLDSPTATNYSSLWSNSFQSALFPIDSIQSVSLLSHSHSNHHQSQYSSTASIHGGRY